MSTQEQPPPTSLAELSNSCVTFVKRAIGIELDYSQDTLPILDHYLREARKHAQQPEVLAPLVATAGAYFGVLTTRQFRGAYLHEAREYEQMRVQFSTIFLHFNPFGIAQEVLSQADAPGWNAHFSTLPDQRKVIEQSLDQGLRLCEEDYYSFSVRYEMLDQVVAVLLALEEQRERPRSFGPAVYAASLGEKVDAEV